MDTGMSETGGIEDGNQGKSSRLDKIWLDLYLSGEGSWKGYVRQFQGQSQIDRVLLDYGIGRIFPDRTSQLKGLGQTRRVCRKLIALAESGSKTLSVRETAEERARGTCRTLCRSGRVLPNALTGELPEVDKPSPQSARQKWSVKDTGVMALLGTPQLKGFTRISYSNANSRKQTVRHRHLGHLRSVERVASQGGLVTGSLMMPTGI